MKVFRLIKHNARLALRGSWSPAILITIFSSGIFALLSFLEDLAIRLFVLAPVMSNPTMEPGPRLLSELVRDMFTYSRVEVLIVALFALLGLIITAPLNLGTARWYYLLSGGQRPAFSEMFYYFERVGRLWRGMWYAINVGVRSSLYGVIFFIFPGIIFGVSAGFLASPETARGLRSAAVIGIFLAGALMLLACVLLSIFLQRYTLAEYLLFEEEEKSVCAVIKRSVRGSKGLRGSLFLFSLSFIGWFFLTPFTMFLLLLYVSPYYGAAKAIYARYIIEKDRRAQSENPETTREFDPSKGSDPEAGGGEYRPDPGEGSESPL